MEAYPHLFSPIKIGNVLVPNRVCHVPTDISSSNADGSVSERDIHHHSEVAKGGTGLGLALVKHIVARHRGRLSIESELGKGATFAVSLPLANQPRT